MSQSTVKVRCGKFANLPPASSPSSNPSLDPRLDQPDINCHFTFCLVPTTTPPSDRAIEKVRDLHLAGACIRVSNCDIHFICFAFQKTVQDIIRAEEAKENGISVASAWNTEFRILLLFLFSVVSPEVALGVIFSDFNSCVAMICPTQTVMLLRAFYPRVNALLSRLKELGCAWD